MREIALHLLDIAENSAAAQSRSVCIEVSENLAEDKLSARVTDDGRGMDAGTARQVLDPFYTTRTTRKVGLGLPLLKLAAETAGGNLTLESEPGRGTRVTVDFQRSHIDRMPLGDLASTFLTLFIAHPDIHWRFVYQVIREDRREQEFVFDDDEIKESLDGLSRTDPEVLGILRGMIEEGIQEVASRAALPV